MSKLISVEEYQKKRAENFRKYRTSEAEETNVACPLCGKALMVDKSMAITTYPVRYHYFCDCGYIQTM